jgi:LysM repeat protein
MKHAVAAVALSLLFATTALAQSSSAKTGAVMGGGGRTWISDDRVRYTTGQFETLLQQLWMIEGNKQWVVKVCFEDDGNGGARVLAVQGVVASAVMLTAEGHGVKVEPGTHVWISGLDEKHYFVWTDTALGAPPPRAAGLVDRGKVQVVVTTSTNGEAPVLVDQPVHLRGANLIVREPGVGPNGGIWCGSVDVKRMKADEVFKKATDYAEFLIDAVSKDDTLDSHKPQPWGHSYEKDFAAAFFEVGGSKVLPGHSQWMFDLTLLDEWNGVVRVMGPLAVVNGKYAPGFAGYSKLKAFLRPLLDRLRVNDEPISLAEAFLGVSSLGTAGSKGEARANRMAVAASAMKDGHPAPSAGDFDEFNVRTVTASGSPVPKGYLKNSYNKVFSDAFFETGGELDLGMGHWNFRLDATVLNAKSTLHVTGPLAIRGGKYVPAFDGHPRLKAFLQPLLEELDVSSPDTTEDQDGLPPPPVTVKKGDTLAKIARESGRTVDAIEKANPTLDPAHLQPGDTVDIPPPPLKVVKVEGFIDKLSGSEKSAPPR